MELDEGVAICKTRVPADAAGRALADCGLRRRYGVTVVGVKRHGQPFIHATPDTVVQAGDLLIVAGTAKELEAFAAST